MDLAVLGDHRLDYLHGRDAVVLVEVLDDELADDIISGRVILYEHDGNAVGLLHHKTLKSKTEIRHLCVNRSYRGRGIGEKLVRAYHAHTTGMTRRVWVRQDYLSAVETYKKCGYTADGMISHVLIYR